MLNFSAAGSVSPLSDLHDQVGIQLQNCQMEVFPTDHDIKFLEISSVIFSLLSKFKQIPKPFYQETW